MAPVRRRVRFPALHWLCIGTACIATLQRLTGAEGKGGGNERKQYAISGRDPKAFADAEAMYARPRLLALDKETARAILVALREAGAGPEQAPWSPRLWAQLDRLYGTEMPVRLTRELLLTAGAMAPAGPAPTRSGAAAALKAFNAGNEAYEAGRFDHAVAAYREALGHDPRFWDAWNNMALAEMHSGNDLVALFLLAALGKNNPSFAGASINLSVCLARLGQGESAYSVAEAVVREHERLPMACYNLAWFENSRGRYEDARDSLARAVEGGPYYLTADWLGVVNTLESGHRLGADDLASLPPAERFRGVPEVVCRAARAAGADAFAGEALVARIPPGSQLVISETAGSWSAVYWVVDGTKRRLWVASADLGAAEAPETDDLSAFLGTWTEQWGSVSASDSLSIRQVDGQPDVTSTRGRTWGARVKWGRLTFRLVDNGGGEFVYTLRWRSGMMSLEVLRCEDEARFTGQLTK